MSHLTVDKQN